MLGTKKALGFYYHLSPSSSAPLNSTTPAVYIVGPLEGAALASPDENAEAEPTSGSHSQPVAQAGLNPGLLLRPLLLPLVPPSQPSPQQQQEGPTLMCLDPVRLDSFLLHFQE